MPVERCAVVGLGKLGACLAACLAAKGFRVWGVDRDAGIRRQLQDPQAWRPVEPQVQELLVAAATRFTVTAAHSEAQRRAEAIFVIVPTPSEPDGAFSNALVEEAMRQVGAGLAETDGYRLVVLVSTVMPGTMARVVQPLLEQVSGKRCGLDFGLCYSPLFVSLGNVVTNILRPDFVLIGESDPKAGATLAAIYERLCDTPPTVQRMGFANAELTKLAVNTFVTTKIAFANMLAQLCAQLPGGDIDVVTRAVGQDRRIGYRYLQGGASYGGPCFPRDNRALAALAQQLGVGAELAVTTDQMNRQMMSRVAAFLAERLPRKATVLVLGMAYKPDTDVTEASAGAALAAELLEGGCRVVAYDPHALAPAQRLFGSRITYAASLAEGLQQAHAAAIVTPWPEFARLRPDMLPVCDPAFLLFDCWRLCRAAFERAQGIRYFGLGVQAPGAASLTRSPVLAVVS